MNDVTLPGGDFESALADLEEVYRQLSECGATVLTTTFPDVVRLLPTGASSPPGCNASTR